MIQHVWPILYVKKVYGQNSGRKVHLNVDEREEGCTLRHSLKYRCKIMDLCSFSYTDLYKIWIHIYTEFEHKISTQHAMIHLRVQDGRVISYPPSNEHIKWLTLWTSQILIVLSREDEARRGNLGPKRTSVIASECPSSICFCALESVHHSTTYTRTHQK